MRCATRSFLLLFALGLAAPAYAGDAYYNVPVTELKLTEGKLPEREYPAHHRWQAYAEREAMTPYAVLDGAGEVYVVNSWASFGRGGIVGVETRLVIRAEDGKDLSGRLFVPKGDISGMALLRFALPASEAKPEAKAAFRQGKIEHYERLHNRDIPGGAWFRHQVRLTQAEMGLSPAEIARRPTPWQFRRGDDLTRTYELFTGSRALSENLQLDRALFPMPANQRLVKIDSLPGITIREIDWKRLLPSPAGRGAGGEGAGPNQHGLSPARPHPNPLPDGEGTVRLDPLAAKIPFDQHVVFLPTFEAAMAMSDEASRHDTPALEWAQPRSEDRGVVRRYQEQLGLTVSRAARLLGPTVAKSVALTGSDPYLPAGTDLAVLFESDQPGMLERLLLVNIEGATANRQAKPVQGEVAGLHYQGFLSPDRSVSSYVARLDGAVVVTNSTAQLARLAAVKNGQVKPVSTLPEYAFFRNRYRLGDADETAFLFLSDATIRRWCSPRWRIADSRRTRAAALLAELQAGQLVLPEKGDSPHAQKGTVPFFRRPGPIHTDLPLVGGGKLEVTPQGVASSTYGTLTFMTPIAEIPLTEATQAEADAYRLWRDGYQRNWSWAFDPVALRLCLGQRQVAADLSVMPLIADSQYHELISLTQGAKFGPTDADPHDALAQLVVALNHDSREVHQVETFAAMMGQKISLGWVGSHASIYADDDPFWKDLAGVKADDLEKFAEKNIGRLPVAVRIDAPNPLKLAMFLTAGRAFIEQSSPGLTHWESLKYHEQPYVRITPVKGRVPRGEENITIYYTTLGGALTVTLNEQMLQRAIDRATAGPEVRSPAFRRPEPAKAGTTNGVPEPAKAGTTNGVPEPAKAGTTSAAGEPWLGSSAALRVDRRILEVANAVLRREYEQLMQTHCWNNLPILNEWKRLYPDRDPVEVHRAVWGVELICPGGGKYVWNDKYQTMESTVYGSPAVPREGPPAPAVLSSFLGADFGLTFENQGLRARAALRRPPAK